MRRSKTLCLLILLTVLAFCFTPASAQSSSANKPNPCPTPVTIDTWFDCMVSHVATPLVNQRESTKQVEVPSIAENTTSLVDQTAAPDLFGLALNLAGVNSNSSGTNNPSMSVTTSAYALFASAVQRDPLDPEFYTRNPNLRRFSFTIGQDKDDQDASGKKSVTLLGTKVLIINGRDASLRQNRERLRQVSEGLRKDAPDYANIAFDIQEYLFSHLSPAGKSKFDFLQQDLNGAQLQTTLNRLTPQQVEEIQGIIARRIQSRVELTETTKKIYETIRRAPQLSFTFQSKLREGSGTDEYRAGLLFDYGIYQRINLTANGTFDYQNAKIIGGDKRGGRFAVETNFQLTPEKYFLGAARPFIFSVAGEAKWMNNTPSTYTGQLKLTIPIFEGMNLPISVSFANRTGLIKESTVRGRFGFTLDFAKLLSKLRQ
jgi:hypothetical protein